ncbi:hypothetical protein MMC18_004689 [Xylographa bjoerkii]|nr:hypothetical protein [Xylographa bjoerkii]
MYLRNQSGSIRVSKVTQVLGGQPGNQPANADQQAPPIPSRAFNERVPVKPGIEYQPPDTDTNLPPVRDARTTTLIVDFHMALYCVSWDRFDLFDAEVMAAFESSKEILVASSPTGHNRRTQRGGFFTSRSSLSLDSPSGTLVRSLMDFAKTLEVNSGMHPIPNLMYNAEMDILMLNRQVDHADLVSAEQLQRLCLKYAELSQTISQHLEELLFFHIAGGTKLVIVTEAVTTWLETIATKHRQRFLAVSLLNFARGYDESRSRVVRVYDYFFPEKIAVLDDILAPLDSLVKEFHVLMNLIRFIQAQIDWDGKNTADEYAHLRKSIFRSLGLYGGEYRKSRKQLEMLGNITALIEIPEKRLIESRQLHDNAKASFIKIQSTIANNTHTEFFRAVSRSELIDELKVGSRAIADALDHIETERTLYDESVYSEGPGIHGTTSMRKREQRKIGA